MDRLATGINAHGQRSRPESGAFLSVASRVGRGGIVLRSVNIGSAFLAACAADRGDMNDAELLDDALGFVLRARMIGGKALQRAQSLGVSADDLFVRKLSEFCAQHTLDELTKTPPLTNIELTPMARRRMDILCGITRWGGERVAAVALMVEAASYKVHCQGGDPLAYWKRKGIRVNAMPNRRARRRAGKHKGKGN